MANNEGQQYQQDGGPKDPFEGVEFPEKFLKDGKPDLVTFVNSYGELETNFRTKTEDLRKTIQSEIEAEAAKTRVEAPDKYTLPKIEGVDEKELAEHPLLKDFREDAFKAGFTDAQFGAAVTRYVQTLTPKEPDMAAVNAALGENAAIRIKAVETWARGYAKTDGEMEALKGIATSADGIKLIERLAGLKVTEDGGSGGGGGAGKTLEELRAMQQDPRYWDPGKRDPKFVDEVTQGYEKLYAKKPG